MAGITLVDRVLPLQLALLDLDGTLINNEHDFFYGYLIQIYEQLGERAPEKNIFDSQIRRNELFFDIPESARENFVKSFWSLFDVTNFPDPDPIQGVEETLEGLLQKGLSVAIITARTQLPQDVEHQLKKTNFLKYIHVISTLGEDHLRHCNGAELKKEQILHVCKQLSIAPAKSFVAGDSPTDIISGKAAEVSLTVGLLSGGLDREIMSQYGPDLLLDTLADIKSVISHS